MASSAQSPSLPKQRRPWLPEPPAGSYICLGFDGSRNNDWTSLRAETMDGFQFTPRWGPADTTTGERRGTFWDPAAHGDRIPHGEVDLAVHEVFDRFEVVRMYPDPFDFETDIDNWRLEFGEERVITWPTNRVQPMYEELRRFETDLLEGRIRHDGCPVTATHMDNARKVAQSGQRYTLGKPSETQKIDKAMTSVLAHAAKCDALAAGWAPKAKAKVRVWRG